MSIQFGGLATGMDTTSIISQLMALEQKPITKIQSDETWLKSRLSAFSQLDTKLKSFADSITNLNDADTLLQRSVQQSTSDFLTATVSSNAQPGASYQVEVVSLAQVQKSVSNGVASKTSTSFGPGSLTLTVDGVPHDIAITDGNNSLVGIMQAINNANIGVSAAIINDGSTSPYRLILTGANVGKDFSLDSSKLSSPTDASYTLDMGQPVQNASQAEIKVDTVDIKSNSNTLTEAIPGVTLNLLQAKVGTTTSLNISVDTNSIKSTISAIAKGYNDVISFITSQSVINGSSGGVLNGDASINSIKRHLQSMLTQQVSNSGTFTSLSQLGFETQKDGTLVVNDKKLSAAVSDHLDSVVSLLTDQGGNKGLATQFQTYLAAITDSSTGMLHGQTTSINANLRRMDNQITSMQARLDQKQKILEAQFSAMENLVSGLNSQSTYLAQQMSAISGSSK